MLWFLAPTLAMAGAGLTLAIGAERRADAGVIGAVAGALALNLLQPALVAALPVQPGLVLAAAAALFFLGAGLIARPSLDAARDRATAAWVGAATEVAALAIHTGLHGRPEPLAYGLLACALALAARRLSWLGLPQAAALAALVSLSSLLGPQIAGVAMVGSLGWTDLGRGGGGGVLAQAGAWRILRGRADARMSADAVSTSALISGLLAVFLVLRVWATPRGAIAAPLGLFTEAALRTVLLLTAGLVLSLRSGSTLISRARAVRCFSPLAPAHGILFGMLVLNPWWGFGAQKRSSARRWWTLWRWRSSRPPCCWRKPRADRPGSGPG